MIISPSVSNLSPSLFLSSLHHHTGPFSVLRSHLFCLILIQIIINSVSLCFPFIQPILGFSAAICQPANPHFLLQFASQQILTFTAICQPANPHLLPQLSISHLSACNCLAICLSTHLPDCLTSIGSINTALLYFTFYHTSQLSGLVHLQQ